MKKHLIFTFILFIIFACTKEQNTISFVQKNQDNKSEIADTISKYSLEQIDNEKGLSNSSVNYIFQDSQNLLWIGTWDGLNRFDGSNFKIFRPEPNKKNSLSNQVVLKIDEDKKGDIWIVTMHGINRYSKKSDSFKHYFFSKNSKTPLTESHFHIAVNDQGDVFCAVKGWGLGYFTNETFQPLNNNPFAAKTIVKIEFLQNGNLIALFDDSTLYSVSIKQGSGGLRIIDKTDLLLGDVRTFDITPKSGISIVNTKGNSFLFDPQSKKRIILHINSIDEIIGSTGQELILFGKSGYTVSDPSGTIINTPWNKYLNNHKVTHIIKGTENILWVGTDGDGILKIQPGGKSFGLISKLHLPPLDGAIVRAFVNDSNSLWVGTKGNGLLQLNTDFYTNPDSSIKYKIYNESNSILNNAVYALKNAKDNLLLIGTDGVGLTVYDRLTSKLVSWKEIIGTDKYDYFKSVYSIYQDDKGYIWMGTNGYGMVRCKIERTNNTLKVSSFKRYSAGSATAISSNIIFSILPEGKSKLWIGTRLGGLNLFDTRSEKFITYKNDINNSHSLLNDDILCLSKDAAGTLWIGTSLGLSKLQSLQNGKAIFKNYIEKDGLPNNTIHGIVPVDNKTLWLSSSFGLASFKTAEEKFTAYTKSDGLQNNEFADGSFYLDRTSGYIFMGGIKGFNYFKPKDIKTSDELPDLFIDKISGHNQSIPYYQGLVIAPNSVSHPSLTLKHNQNFFDIYLSALTYTNNDKCQYSYKMEGFDKEWNTIDNRKIISFTNVPRGSYILYIKWSNSNGVWSEPVKALDIRIKPVWWQSNLAVTIYLMLTVLFLLFVRSYYQKRQSLRDNILIRKKEEELHENRLTFFTNIAHEFLTPLTLIVGPAHKLSEDTKIEGRNRKYMHMIQRNASRLLFLTQQLLEFRKAEYDYLENTVKEFDLVTLIEQIAELFDDWAFDKNISYTIDVTPSLSGWFDKDKLEKIVFNLLSNAFKFTPRNGSISLKCFIENKNLNIIISNTGEGISKEKLDSLFDRFFLSNINNTSDTEILRTGIGLAYIKKLVTVLRGEISVSSQPNILTVFTIEIPCDKSSFKEKEIDSGTVSILISPHLKDILEEKEEIHEVLPDKILNLDILENDRKKVLVVEDEKEIQNYIKDLLSDKYKILSAYNGDEALKILNSELPDIIISDVMMPVMDGVELCKTVKNDLRTCHIPFIMLTAKNSVLHRIEGLESGANSYIPKPFHPDHLIVRIQKLIEEKELILRHFTQDVVAGNVHGISLDSAEKAFIKVFIDHIKQNIDNENLNSAFIEKKLGMSTSQLYRKTKEAYGLSPGDLIRTIRLKYAAELLRKNVLTVSEVCYKSGFNNRSYFYREFKKVYNTTPKSYQLDYKAKSAAFLNN
ncbi:two-component regulator propeller domain-containing protein [Flavobacterium sp. AG291]|uniref:hybrid sensor histidine kinase/response regulator transcription factor n=1 Tax=Flavobacterium sp. AG291 TaxID=2184000 RepID=UPI000E0BC2F7|nr:two-component regulator propeller domain-containing protein [Flavobacterium sp. AG291]RDI10453.1 signal transduction histidine kinase [Flavobacterium sp. AG291]